MRRTLSLKVRLVVVATAAIASGLAGVTAAHADGVTGCSTPAAVTTSAPAPTPSTSTDNTPWG